MTQTAFESTRERVVAAAATLFARHGYHGTSVTDLSETVDLGKGALYRYIGSKEDLLYEISIKQVDRLNTVAEQITESDLPATEMLHELGRALLCNIAEH